MQPSSSVDKENRRIISPLSRESLDPRLVHRVLLTDPSQFDNLTMSGKPRLQETPTFEQFEANLASNPIQRAYYDHILGQLQEHPSNDNELVNAGPLQDLISQLHSQIRSLVPNRTDLHSLLDENPLQATSLSRNDLQDVLKRAAQALIQLESPARAETTQAWQKTSSSSTETTSTRKLVVSLLYLIFKAELCESEIQDFYLATIWAPQIHQHGLDWEREWFQEQYGSWQSPSTAPRTRAWIQSMVAAHRDSQTTLSSTTWKTRRDWVRTSWVNDILFRSADQPTLELPEVFALDQGSILQIRTTTRLTVAADAVVLHATASSADAVAFFQKESSKQSILQALRNRRPGQSQEEYERAAADVVVGLVRELRNDVVEETALRNRITAVLRGTDPVLPVLDRRMKETFSELVLCDAAATPRHLASGLAKPDKPPSLAFVEFAQDAFGKRGLKIWAPELAKAAQSAVRVIDLTWSLYGSELIVPIMTQDIQDRIQTS